MSQSLENLKNAANNSVTGPQDQDALEQGNQRGGILSTFVPTGLGMFGSPYSAADALKGPPQIGVRAGDSMGDVVNAVAGVAYYIDQIGFGESSNPLTNNPTMDLKPLGVNYFMETGVKCSNGAQMWEYMRGITEGNAFGDRIKDVMQEMGMPGLKGLAPGMIEDAERALNPAPLMKALFGSGYAQCEEVTLPVGDARGKIKGDDGTPWISNSNKVIYKNGKPFQKRWVYKNDLTREQWNNSPKTMNFDGTPRPRFRRENFQGYITHPATMITVGVLCLLAYAFVMKKR
jgi:hypothetical protein